MELHNRFKSYSNGKLGAGKEVDIANGWSQHGEKKEEEEKNIYFFTDLLNNFHVSSELV